MGFLQSAHVEIMQRVAGKKNMFIQCRKETSLILRTNEKNNMRNKYMKQMKQQVHHISTTRNTKDCNTLLTNMFSKRQTENTKNISNIHFNKHFNRRVCSFGSVKEIGSVGSIGSIRSIGSIGLTGLTVLTGPKYETFNSSIKYPRSNKLVSIEDSFFNLKTKRNKSESIQKEGKQTSWNPDASLEKRYALALYNVSKKKNMVSVMVKDMQYLQKNLIKNTETNNFFNMPVVSQEIKIKALVDICKKSNPNNPILVNFVTLVFKKGRYKDLEKIFTTFFTIVEEEKEVIQCVVYTAKPLTEDKKKAVYNKIQEVSKGVYEPKIRYEVDPSILGGIIYHVGSNVYDFSTRERTNQIIAHLT